MLSFLVQLGTPPSKKRVRHHYLVPYSVIVLCWWDNDLVLFICPSPGVCHASNIDGREFIRKHVKEQLTRATSHSEEEQMVAIMNLPALAIEFLDAFVGVVGNASSQPAKYTEGMKVYCYCFSKGNFELPCRYVIRIAPTARRLRRKSSLLDKEPHSLDISDEYRLRVFMTHLL